jgi:hypothetical protein
MRVPISQESSNDNIIIILIEGEMVLHLMFSLTSHAATTTIPVVVEVSLSPRLFNDTSSVQRLYSVGLDDDR